MLGRPTPTGKLSQSLELFKYPSTEKRTQNRAIIWKWSCYDSKCQNINISIFQFLELRKVTKTLRTDRHHPKQHLLCWELTMVTGQRLVVGMAARLDAPKKRKKRVCNEKWGIQHFSWSTSHLWSCACVRGPPAKPFSDCFGRFWSVLVGKVFP